MVYIESAMGDTTVASLMTILAVVVGGLLNHLASRWTKNREWKLSLRRQQIDTRTKLYADFLAGTQRLVTQSIDEKFSGAAQFDVLYNEYARIEFSASSEVYEKAKELMDHVLECHAQGSREPKKKFTDLKHEFISVVKTELQQLEKA